MIGKLLPLLVGLGEAVVEWRERRKKARAAARKQAAKETAVELDLVRSEAGTKARWESDLSEQARSARAKAKTPRP